jgi:hypothetical protein
VDELPLSLPAEASDAVDDRSATGETFANHVYIGCGDKNLGAKS